MTTIEYRTAGRPTVGGFRPDLGHLAVWAVASALAMAVGVNACLRYNAVAGTDLDGAEIAARAAGMNAGPLAGPAWLWPVPLAALALGWLPFLVRRRPPGRTGRAAVRLANALANALAAVVWYGSAVLALGIHLS